MTLLSTLLEEAVCPASDFVRREAPVYVLEDASGWMGEAMAQVQHVAPQHVAYLKKHTGRGWRLFKRFLSENGRLIVKYEVSKRGDIANDPMIVLRIAYSRAADLYNVLVEVWSSASSQIASHEATDVDIEMLQDPPRLFYGIQKALVQLQPSTRTESLDEAAARRLALGAEGGQHGDWRSNPTKSGPAAERTRVLAQARTSIERMLSAIEVVRGWVKGLGLGDKDKVGAAAAALRAASQEIGKAESVQAVLSAVIEMAMENPGSGWLASMEAAADFVIERRKEPSADAARAKEGLSRMIDGLRQLHGMLRQAKLGGRILGQLDAAINGLKATRDAIDALFECGPVAVDSHTGRSDVEYPPSSVFEKGFTRMRASDVRRGLWVLGGTRSDPIYRKVDRVERLPEDMAYVVFHFTQPYQGADGLSHTAARFHKDTIVSAAKP